MTEKKRNNDWIQFIAQILGVIAALLTCIAAFLGLLSIQVLGVIDISDWLNIEKDEKEIITISPDTLVTPTSSITSVPTQAPTAQAQISPTALIPISMELVAGGTFTPDLDWGWVCTGDFVSSLWTLDTNAQSGMMVIFEQGATLTINVPYGGSCRTFTPSSRANVVSTASRNMFTTSINCQDGCTTITIHTVDSNNNVSTETITRP